MIGIHSSPITTSEARLRQKTETLKRWLEEKPAWVIATAIFFLQFFWAWPIKHSYLSLQDEGNILAWATRMEEGQLPYRDFKLRFMPGTPFLLRLAFAVFGDGIEVARWYFLISLSLVAVCIWLVSARMMPRSWSFLPVLCFVAVGGQVWPMLSPHWDSNVTTLLALFLATQSSRRVNLVASGFFAGLTVLFLQPKGVAICVTLALLALLHAPRVKRLAFIIAGALIPGILFTSWLIYHGNFDNFWEQAIRYNLSSYSSIQKYPFEWDLGWQQLQVVAQGLSQLGKLPFITWSTWFFTALSFALVDIVKYTLFLPVIGVGVLLCRRPKPQRDLLIGLVALLALSTYFTWIRATRYHFNFHTPAWYSLLSYILYNLSLSHRRRSLILSALVMASFSCHGLDNRISWKDYIFPINFSRGLLYSNDAGFASQTQQLTRILSREFSQKPVFGFPEIPMILWLSRCHNPTSFEVLAPVFHSEKEFEVARAQLEGASPCGIVFRPSGASIEGNYPNLPPEQYEAKERELSAMILKGAKPLASLAGFLVYELPAQERKKSPKNPFSSP